MAFHWSTHQLTEYFIAITRSGDVPGAAAVAVERAVEATESEIGAVVGADEILGTLGLGGHGADDELRAASRSGEPMTIAGLGTFHTTSISLGAGVDGFLVLGRLEAAYQPEERQMLRGMAQVLGLASRNLRTLAAERGLRQALEKREQLLETLLQIQRAVSQRAPLQVVLDSVTRGASDLLDGALVALVLRDPADPDASMVPSISPGHEAADALRGVLSGTLSAAPVHVGGDVAGSLVMRVARTREREDFLAAFAEQASLALTDAQSVETVREAYHDGLTGLPNRVLFLERVERALESANTGGTAVTVLFIDLDLFKQVNDSLGHAAGDELLRRVAGRLRGIVRDDDMAARLGGDEFGVLLESADSAAAGAEVAGRIISSLEQPFDLAGRPASIRASVGIALSDPSYATADELIQAADVAMYRAKKSRPGSLLLFEKAMRTERLSHLELAADLKRAVGGGELWVDYQPIIALAGGDLVGVEARPRWTHPRHGEVSPATITALAEESGLLVDVSRWIVRESSHELARRRGAGLPGLTLSVTVSALQLEDDQLIEDVLDILTETGLPAGALTLGVTETALMRDPDRTLRALKGLKAIGVRLALDDFGTGQSSMSNLGRFPIDQVKIGAAFIDRIDSDERAFVIARSVIDLGSVLGLETVAAGIERPGQVEALRALSCGLGQGSLFASPVEAPVRLH